MYVNNKLKPIDIKFDKSITLVRLKGSISPGKFEKSLRNPGALSPPATANKLGCDTSGKVLPKTLWNVKTTLKHFYPHLSLKVVFLLQSFIGPTIDFLFFLHYHNHHN